MMTAIPPYAQPQFGMGLFGKKPHKMDGAYEIEASIPNDIGELYNKSLDTIKKANSNELTKGFNVYVYSAKSGFKVFAALSNSKADIAMNTSKEYLYISPDSSPIADLITNFFKK